MLSTPLSASDPVGALVPFEHYPICPIGNSCRQFESLPPDREKRSKTEEALGTSPISFPQSSNGRLLDIIVWTYRFGCLNRQ
jgi:hypothetical protein